MIGQMAMVFRSEENLKTTSRIYFFFHRFQVTGAGLSLIPGLEFTET